MIIRRVTIPVDVQGICILGGLCRSILVSEYQFRQAGNYRLHFHLQEST